MQRTTTFTIQLHEKVYVFQESFEYTVKHLASVGQFQNTDP